MDEYKVEVDGNEFKTIVQYNSGWGEFWGDSFLKMK
jgi:hypothetical protein